MNIEIIWRQTERERRERVRVLRVTQKTAAVAYFLSCTYHCGCKQDRELVQLIKEIRAFTHLITTKVGGLGTFLYLTDSIARVKRLPTIEIGG